MMSEQTMEPGRKLAKQLPSHVRVPGLRGKKILLFVVCAGSCSGFCHPATLRGWSMEGFGPIRACECEVPYPVPGDSRPWRV